MLVERRLTFSTGIARVSVRPAYRFPPDSSPVPVLQNRRACSIENSALHVLRTLLTIGNMPRPIRAPHYSVTAWTDRFVDFEGYVSSELGS